MTVQIALLRGVGHGPDDQINMASLREALEAAGFDGPETYGEMGNVVFSTEDPPAKLAAHVSRIIDEAFDAEVHVIVRSYQELAEVLARDPRAGRATNPQHYYVTFFESELAAAEVESLRAVTTEGDEVIAIGRELYVWHPHDTTGSKVVDAIRAIQTPATARSWSAVAGIVALAGTVSTNSHRSKRDSR